MKRIMKHPLFWIVLASVVSLVSYMRPGMPFVDDGQDHVVRVATFFASLREGILIPRWGANLNWGYGHPVIMFLYPFSAYLGSAFHAFGLSFVDSTKLVFIVAALGSVLTMYLWMNSAFGKRAAIIGSLLYFFAPYRFVDLYVRGAIGEHMAFVFPPLILYFLYKIVGKIGEKKKIFFGIGLSLSFAGMILAHNAISLMFLPIIACYIVYLFFTEANKSIVFLVRSFLYLVLGLGVAGFFWIPAFFEGKYTLRDIVTKGEALGRFVPASWFLYSPWNYGGGNETTKFLGIPQWMGVIGACILLWGKQVKKVPRWLLGGSLILLGAVLFIMTSSSRFIWERIMVLQNFQFPWRFQSVSVFLTALIAGIVISYYINLVQSKKQIIFIVFCVFSVLITSFMWHPRGYKIEHESFYTGIYKGTTDTGESSPIWSVRFMEHTPAQPIEVIDGVASIQESRRSSIEHVYTITAKKPSRILENTLYFPGWKAYIDDQPTGIQFQDPTYRGLMTFRVTEGEHTVRVVFENTKLRGIANVVSLASFGMIGILIGIGCVWRKRT